VEAILAPHGEELLRAALARNPQQSPGEIVEEALAERIDREGPPSSIKRKLTHDDFHDWLDQFTAYSDRIPSMPGETFSREMIYQDQD
jgi:hypothetical protein